jgi:hypothetical protein
MEPALFGLYHSALEYFANEGREEVFFSALGHAMREKALKSKLWT